jgi:hypothetical protein
MVERGELSEGREERWEEGTRMKKKYVEDQG